MMPKHAVMVFSQPWVPFWPVSYFLCHQTYVQSSSPLCALSLIARREGALWLFMAHTTTPFIKFLREDIYTQHCFLISRNMLFFGGRGL